MEGDVKKRMCARYIVRSYTKDWEEVQHDISPITAHCLFSALELWNLANQRVARDGFLIHTDKEPAAFVELEVVYVEI